MLRLLGNYSDINETNNFGLHPNRNVIVLYVQNQNVGLTFDLNHNVFGEDFFICYSFISFSGQVARVSPRIIVAFGENIARD
jgi:hypothetical protein